MSDFDSEHDDDYHEEMPEPKRARLDKFVDDIAEDEDDPDAASDDDEGDEDDDANEIIADEDEEPTEPMQQESIHRLPRGSAVRDDDTLHQALYNQQQLDEVDALKARLERKFGHSLDDEDDADLDLDDEEELEEERGPSETGAAVLPSIKDPKLWLVRCDPGKEEEMVLFLLKRYALQKHTSDQTLFIHSAFTTPASKGYIYVEADKEIHVKTAIQGYRQLKWWTCKLVPITQMINAVKFSADIASVVNKQWVRIKGGIYKGDLAQVMHTSDQNTVITIRMIPRIDLDTECAESRMRVNGERVKRLKKFNAVNRPQPALLSIKDIHDHNGETKRQEDARTRMRFTYFNGQRYRFGYLYKDVNINRLIIDGVTPTMDEIETFRSRANRDIEADDDDDDVDNDDGPLLPVNQANGGAMKSAFTLGDRIIVIAGTFKNITGRITSAAKDICSVNPDSGQPISMPIDLAIKEIKKYFQLGDHVKVISGAFKDETGMITYANNTDDNFAVFTDVSQREVKVKGDEVIESSEVSAGRETLGSYELYDLVQLTSDAVGVIVKVEIASFKLLTNRDIVQTVRLAEIGKKRSSRYAAALDSRGNQLVKDDVVVVNSGKFIGRQGTIRHIYRKHLFIFIRSQLENSGISVVQTNQVLLVGQTSGFGRVSNVSLASQSPHPSYDGNKSPHPSRSDNKDKSMPPPRFHRTRIGEAHPLLHKTVTITGGPHKTLMGFVTDINEVSATVELHALAKKVSVSVGLLAERTATNTNNSRSQRVGDFAGSQTPLLGSRTPAWGETGAATPAHESSMTPAHPSVTDTSAWSAMTPYRENAGGDDDEDDENEWQRDHSKQALLTPVNPLVRTPYGNDYQNPRTPLTSGVPHTPVNVHTPLTPVTPAPLSYHDDIRAPSTPLNVLSSSNVSSDTDSASFVYPVGARVFVAVDGNDKQCTISGNNADRSIRITLDDKSQRSVPRSSIVRPVIPSQPGSNVIVTSGHSSGSIGELVGVNVGEAIVNIGGEIIIFPVAQLCLLESK